MAKRGRGREHPALRRGLRVDRVGTEAVVLDPVAALVHRLTGPAAEVMAELVMRGRDVADLPARLAPAVAGLRQAGVLRGEVSRRQALGTAAVGAVGIMTLALPWAATAASPGSGGSGGGLATDVSVTGVTDTLPDLRSTFGTAATAASGYTYRIFSDRFAANRFDVGGSGTLTVDVLIVGAASDVSSAGGTGWSSQAGSSSVAWTGGAGWISGLQGGGGGGAGAGGDGFGRIDTNQRGGPGGYGFEVTGSSVTPSTSAPEGAAAGRTGATSR